MKLSLAEIIENMSQLKTQKEKVEYLQANDSRQLQDLIQYALHPAIKWDLPPGNPPYKKSELLDIESSLYREIKKFHIFVNGNGSRLSPTRLETLFIQTLESISPKDAELILLVKDRKLPKGLTQKIIDETWPGLIPNEENTKVSQE